MKLKTILILSGVTLSIILGLFLYSKYQFKMGATTLTSDETAYYFDKDIDITGDYKKNGVAITSGQTGGQETDPVWNDVSSSYRLIEENQTSKLHWSAEFLTTLVNVQQEPWFCQTFSSGAFIVVTSTGVNSPGLISFRDTTSNNAGARCSTEPNALTLGGGEKTNFVFITAPAASRASTTIRMGFLDVFSLANANRPIDGAYLEIARDSGTLCGVTINNRVASTTPICYAYDNDTQYRATIEVVNPYRVNFAIYDVNGTELWSDYLTENIPTTSLRAVGHGITVTEASTTPARDRIIMDYMDLTINRNLIR